MKVDKRRCDFCEKEVEDYYSERGWIQFGTLTRAPSITVSAGRAPDRHAVTICIAQALDFCSVGCVAAYIQKLADEGYKKMEAILEADAS